MAEAAASRFKGKQVEVEILTDTYKIRGTLFVPLAGKDGYSASVVSHNYLDLYLRRKLSYSI